MQVIGLPSGNLARAFTAKVACVDISRNPEGHAGIALDATYVGNPLLGDGEALVEVVNAGRHWAALPQLFHLTTEVEFVVVHLRADDLDLDFDERALLDGSVDCSGRQDCEVVTPVILL